jgi:hypothetical protein
MAKSTESIMGLSPGVLAGSLLLLEGEPAEAIRGCGAEAGEQACWFCGVLAADCAEDL